MAFQPMEGMQTAGTPIVVGLRQAAELRLGSLQLGVLVRMFDSLIDVSGAKVGRGRIFLVACKNGHIPNIFKQADFNV